MGAHAEVAAILLLVSPLCIEHVAVAHTVAAVAAVAAATAVAAAADTQAEVGKEQQQRMSSVGVSPHL